MQVVTYPTPLIESFLDEARELLRAGRVAEGSFFRESARPFVEGRHSVPVSSGGAGIFSLLAFHKHAKGKSVAIVQSNTMRALYTVPKLVGMEPRVVPSSYEDFMAMSPDALERALREPGAADAAVVVYSVIGGYLAPSFASIAAICAKAGVPLIVDGAHAHYMPALHRVDDLDIAYSFYATKILPAGEGGLIVSPSPERMAWLRRFLIYDRFENSFDVGLNLRASELTGALIHRLLNDPNAVEHFKHARVRLAERYRALCEKHGLRYLDPGTAADYNGYKLIVLDSLADVQALRTGLTEHPPTSAVFDTDVLGQRTQLPHWCPPTYSSLEGAGAR
jgi:dTDP-4-amino-4,6-dideoxygalactose transaminase